MAYIQLTILDTTALGFVPFDKVPIISLSIMYGNTSFSLLSPTYLFTFTIISLFLSARYYFNMALHSIIIIFLLGFFYMVSTRRIAFFYSSLDIFQASLFIDESWFLFNGKNQYFPYLYHLYSSVQAPWPLSISHITTLCFCVHFTTYSSLSMFSCMNYVSSSSH